MFSFSENKLLVRYRLTLGLALFPYVFVKHCPQTFHNVFYIQLGAAVNQLVYLTQADGELLEDLLKRIMMALWETKAFLV